MTAIDHAAEARKALEAAIETPADIGPAADPWLLAAQVHATLALVEAQEAAVEQARIANWIAYLTQQDKIPAAHREWIEAALSEEAA